MNSIMERWVQTCRHQLLDCTLIWNRVICCTPSWSSSTSITSTGPTGLSGRQRGRCPLCRGLLLHADHQPQGPEEWQQWHTATRTAIRKHVITSVMDLGTPDERAAHHLIHVHCCRRISGTGPALLPAPSLQGCLSRAARKRARPFLRGRRRQRAAATRQNGRSRIRNEKRTNRI
jgi:hypothetical protein